MPWDSIGLEGRCKRPIHRGRGGKLSQRSSYTRQSWPPLHGGRVGTWTEKGMVYWAGKFWDGVSSFHLLFLGDYYSTIQVSVLVLGPVYSHRGSGCGIARRRLLRRVVRPVRGRQEKMTKAKAKAKMAKRGERLHVPALQGFPSRSLTPSRLVSPRLASEKAYVAHTLLGRAPSFFY